MAFWSQNSFKEPLRQYRWYIDFNSQNGTFSGLDEYVFALKECKKPEYEINLTKHRLLTHHLHYPGLLEWKPIQIKFVSANGDKGSSISKTLDRIARRAGYQDPNQTKHQGIAKNNFEGALDTNILKIVQVGESGEIIEIWNLYNALIKDVNFGNLSYGSDDFVEISMTISYDWAKLEVGDESDSLAEKIEDANKPEDVLAPKNLEDSEEAAKPADPAPAKPENTKPAEKPADPAPAKPENTKPAEKPADPAPAKPENTKPAEKPADPAPVKKEETKPAEKPADPAPVKKEETKSAEKPADPAPVKKEETKSAEKPADPAPAKPENTKSAEKPADPAPVKKEETKSAEKPAEVKARYNKENVSDEQLKSDISKNQENLAALAERKKESERAFAAAARQDEKYLRSVGTVPQDVSISKSNSRTQEAAAARKKATDEYFEAQVQISLSQQELQKRQKEKK